MDMEANFKLTDSKRYLLVKFNGGNVALYSKDNVHVDAYEGWENSEDVEMEELQSGKVADRLVGKEEPISLEEASEALAMNIIQEYERKKRFMRDGTCR